MNSQTKIRIAVSGIPRGYHFPRPDGNWLQAKHRVQIQQLSPRIELLEIPAHQVATTDLTGIELVLAEGGNRIHYPGELDWADYLRFFTPGLRWIQLCSTGFSDNITPDIVAGRVTLTNAPGLHTIPIAESVLAAMLDHAKNLRQRRLDQQAHRWAQLKNDELGQRTVLIVGLGRIGQEVARLCRAFGMRVLGCKRRLEPVAGVAELFSLADLPRYMPQVDYLVLALPLTPQTEGVIDRSMLALLPPSAFVANVGRGRTVDEAALLEMLTNGRLAGAYLDALTTEPLPPDHPLWELNNVLLIPHDSHSSPHIGDRMVNLFCDNLSRYIAGEPLQNICDPARGY